MGLTYNGQDLFDDWGIMVDSSETWAKPERDREFIHVPGRSGDLILDRGSWMNVEITYHCHIDDNFYTKFEQFVEWLSLIPGYAELYDEHHPDVYRLAAPEMVFDVETTFTDRTANFDLVFNCKPQQFINDGSNHILSIDFTNEGDTQDINPNTNWNGSPLVTVYASGGARFQIEYNGDIWDFVIDSLPDPDYRLVIDFETGNAEVEDSMGNFVSNGNSYYTVTPPSATSPDFPPSDGILYVYHEDPDDPNITYTGTLDLDPRFWRI